VVEIEKLSYNFDYFFRLIATTLIITVFISGCGDSKSKSRVVESKVVEKNSSIKIKNSYLIEDIDRRKTDVVFSEGRVYVKKVIQPIIIFYIFSKKCPPCRGMLPYLSMLQRRYSRDIFIIGIILEKTDFATLRQFMKRYNATFFISDSIDNTLLIDRLIKENKISKNYLLPLTIIYRRGEKVIDIYGAVPYEMLETIIKQEKKEAR